MLLPHFPGELRLRLCRRKTGGYFGTTKSFAGAGAQARRVRLTRAADAPVRRPGIFIKNVVEFMVSQNCSVYKGFSLWTNEDTPTCCGVIMLKLARPA
jgi:hypothetical protein